MKIALSDNRATLGKIEQGDTPAWRVFNGSFNSIDISLNELMQKVQQGYAYTAQHTRYRSADNFICAQHIALDMDTQDSRSSIPVLAADPFIAKYAAFIHTTPSHTPEQPKARVVFMLDRPITNAGKYAELMTALVSRFKMADKACKDAARFFYGAMNCDLHFIGNTFALEDAANELIHPYRKEQEEQAQAAAEAAKNRVVVASNEVPEHVLHKHSQSLLDRVRMAPDGEKYITLRDTSIAFGGYVAGGYYPHMDVVSWLQQAIRSNQNNVKDMRAAFQAIEESITYGMARPLYFELNQNNDYLDHIDPPLTPSQKEQVQRIISRDVWQAYHDGMNQTQREYWHKYGFSDALVDYFNLGYCQRHVDEETGEIIVEAALTIPFTNETGEVINVEYRHKDGNVSYETEIPSLYYVERTDNPLLIWPDTMTALHSYLSIGSLPYTFSGLPQMTIGHDTVQGEAVVMLDPDTETAGRKLARSNARFIRLPLAASDMIRRGAGVEDFSWYIQQARGVG